MKRSDITVAALAMVGTPFHAQGRLPGVGLDCIGVIVCIAKQMGIVHSDVTGYPMRPNGQLMPTIDAQLERVTGDPQEGDVLVMSFSKDPHHVAVVIDGGRIVHAYAMARKCVVQAFSEHWRSKVHAVYRFPGVE